MKIEIKQIYMELDRNRYIIVIDKQNRWIEN